MSKLLERTKAFLKSEDGPTATEYAVLLALIAIAIIVAVTALGGAISGKFGEAQAGLEAAGGGG